LPNSSEKTFHALNFIKNLKSDLRVVSIISMVVFLTVWEAVVRVGFVTPLFLPAPSMVLEDGIRLYERGEIWLHVSASARRVLIGFALAGSIAVPLGILLGASKFLKAIADPLLSILRPLPSMAWIPLSLLWLGITETQKYSIVFMGSFAPTVLYTIEATRSIDPVLIRAALNLGASRMSLMREVILPGALQPIISGLKVMLGIAWTTVISAELVAADKGLGYLIMHGREFFRTEQVLLGMALISMTVMLIDIAFRSVEKKITPWTRG